MRGQSSPGEQRNRRGRGIRILTDAGITKGIAGENIGWGYPDAQSVCEAWKASETHYENIMTADFTKTGAGVAADPDKDGKLCWAQLFLNPKN